MALFRRGAAAGSSLAQYALGNSHLFGAGGLREDAAEAARWYRRAAEQGNPVAATALARRYERGEGVERSLDEAERWFIVGAEGGEVFAKRALVRMGRPRGRGRASGELRIQKTIAWIAVSHVTHFFFNSYIVGVCGISERDKTRRAT